jgi:branched-chain amino acid transport system ATP-binding protein
MRNNEILELDNICVKFGGILAVSNFNLKLNKGELIGLIGPNGAGKTTVFNIITGIYQPTDGILVKNKTRLIGLATHEIVSKNIARTFQNIRLFKNMSVEDNIKAAYHLNTKYNILDAILKNNLYKNEENEIHEKTVKLLSIFSLNTKKHLKANALSYGEQRKLEIARALATRPEILLLDEPACGMNNKETQDLIKTISFIKKEFNLSILLIEHDMNFVMEICERILVLDHGVTIAQGKPEQIKNDKKVLEAYLGEPVW